MTDTTLPDRLLNRVDTLVASIRKIDTALDGDSGHPMKERMLERRTQYQTSLKNIQEHGVERIRGGISGVTINVPTDVMEVRST